MKRFAFVLCLLILTAGFAFSLDYGVLVEQQLVLQSENRDDLLLGYNPRVTPWFSWMGENGLSVYLSGLVNLQYTNLLITEEGKDGYSGWGDPYVPVVTPELTRFCLTYNTSLFSVEAGRIWYNDVTGLAASGLFDGARFAMGLPFGSISASAFYTGFLYKENAEIKMTWLDTQEFDKQWFFDDFGKYFGSKRVIASVQYNIPFLEFHNLSFEVLAQFDVNGERTAFHSQYGEAMANLYLNSVMGLNAGVLFEAKENQAGEFGAGFGAITGFRMLVPGGLNDMVRVTGKFGSGFSGDYLGYFSPINSHKQGEIFDWAMGGLWTGRVSYEIRILQSLFAEASFSLFGRTWKDEGYYNYETQKIEKSSPLHGFEAWTSAAYQPFDDIRVTLGGGAFFPTKDSAYSSDIIWKVSAGLTMSF